VLVDPNRCAVRHVGSSISVWDRQSLPEHAPTIHDSTDKPADKSAKSS
jgi:hypothetical protein